MGTCTQFEQYSRTLRLTRFAPSHMRFAERIEQSGQADQRKRDSDQGVIKVDQG